jgi:hypothetical protein
MLPEEVSNWIDQSDLPQSDAEDIYAWLERNGISKEFIEIGFNFDKPDPIAFAIEKLGWIRVKMYDGACNINCLSFNESVRSRLSDTLYEIFGNGIFYTRLVVESTELRTFAQIGYEELQ